MSEHDDLGHVMAILGAAKTIPQSELNRLCQQIHELRRALRPFAKFAGALPPVIVGKNRITDSGPMLAQKSQEDPTGFEVVVSFTDFRHAKALLDRLEAADTERHIETAEKQMTAFNCRFCGAHSRLTSGHAEFCSDTCYDNAVETGMVKKE